MASWTFPTRTYNPGSEVLALTGRLFLTERSVGFEMIASQWAAGRILTAIVEESFDGGLNWQHAVGGTWVGPQPTDGTVVASATVSLPDVGLVDRSVYALRVRLTLAGGTIRVGVSVSAE